MDDGREQRESILSVATKWLPWCLALVFALTIGWAIFVARVEVLNPQGRDSSEIAIAAAIKTAATLPLIVLCSLFITTMLDILGGATMVTARYLTEKFLEPLREKIRAEGKAEGIAEGEARGEARGIAQGIAEGEARGISEGAARKQREWEDWLRDGQEARERGEPFDEPPPSL